MKPTCPGRTGGGDGVPGGAGDVAATYADVDDLDVRCGINLPKNLCGRPCSSNHCWFTRNDASAGVQCVWNEKLGRDIALPEVFFKRGNNRIVIGGVHGGAENESYVQNPMASIQHVGEASPLAAGFGQKK